MRGLGYSALAGGLAAMLSTPHHLGRTRYPKGYAPHGNSIADKPHKHEREIARRKRQAERIARNRRARAVAFSRIAAAAYPEQGLSRRGRPVQL